MSHWLRSELNFKKPSWYRPYQQLNSMPIPPHSLMQIQANAIKQNNSKAQKEVDVLNDFLMQLQSYYNANSTADDEQDFFQTFLKVINSGYAQTGGGDGVKPSKDAQFIEQYEQRVLKFLDYIVQFSGKKIPEQIMYDLERIVEHLRGQNFYGFRARKADLWESLGVWILQLSGFQAVNTGAMIDAAGKQLIQDAGSLLNPENLVSKTPGGGLLNFELRFSGTESKKDNQILLDYLKTAAKGDQRIVSDSVRMGKKGYVNFQIDTNLQGFTNLIEKASHELKKKITIKVSDEFQERLSEGMTIQAKSGAHQSLLNLQKRDQITAQQLVNWDQYLSILQQFYMNKADDSRDIESNKIEAYANWVFSKNIAKTTLGKNKFFLSHYGFSTLDQIMEKNNIGFALAPNPNTMRLAVSTGVFNIVEVNEI